MTRTTFTTTSLRSSRALRAAALAPLAALASACSAPADAPGESAQGVAQDLVYSTGSETSTLVIAKGPRPTVTLGEVTRLQPGWVRAKLTWSIDVPMPRVALVPTCSASGLDASVTATPLVVSRSGRSAIVDLKTDVGWHLDHGEVEPCHVTALTATVAGFGTLTGSTTRSIDFDMDAAVAYRPLTQIASRSIVANSLPLTVPASARRWVAYSPRQFAVHTPAGTYAVLEVESLPGRGTLGVRGLKSWTSWGSRGLDFNGGAEIYPGWGVDVERQGITKPMSGTEISNPGVHTFASGGVWTASMMSSPSTPVLPAAPLFSDGQYAASFLDNHGIPLNLGGLYDLDVMYDASSDSLVGMNGATLAALDLDGRLDAPATLSESIGVAPPAPGLLVADTTPPATPAGPAAGCGIRGTTIAVTLSACTGAKNSGFRCPTGADPLKPESMPSVPQAGEVSLYRTISPMLASRGNVLFGDCGTHAYLQDYETLLNTYAQDLAPRHVFTVDGLPVQVREPAIGLSTSANHWARYTMMGTQLDADNGATNAGPPDPDGLDRPQFLDGYWTAREWYYEEWRSNVRAYDSARADGCANSWTSGFCMGQGEPRPGLYRNYSNMVASRSLDPLRNGAWSLGNAYNPLIQTMIQTFPPVNRPQALRDTMAYVAAGLPVRMTFKAGTTATTDGSGASFSATNAVAWYLPPEIAACSPDILWNTLKPTGGHYVNIVGYSLAGSLDAPDPVNSYFIVQNNWGAGAGREGLFAMSFAYFSFIAEELVVYQLDRTCSSMACARH